MKKSVIRHDAMEKSVIRYDAIEKRVIRHDTMLKIVFVVLFCSFSVSLTKLFSYAVENMD